MFFQFSAIFLLILCAHGAQVEVTTKLGAIIGETVPAPTDSFQKASVTRFLGIPYAQPPVGQLRYRRPRPLTEKHSQPFLANRWPPQCYQSLENPFFIDFIPMTINRNMSEDCLYLNVWSPDVGVASESDLRPVLVFIHGGGLVVGTSSFELYDGAVLASVADAVVVTLNYRLSALGFLYSDAVPEIPGNQGLWDQALALEWIQENIRYFGGDPARVTISGQSAGSWSVSAHILSPVSRPLYSGAILLSGAMHGHFVSTREHAVAKTLIGIRSVGCATEQDTSIGLNVIECLQELPPETAEGLLNSLTDPRDRPGIVIDGEFLPSTSEIAFSEGNFKQPLNLLVSTVEDEMSKFLPALQIKPDLQLDVQLAQKILEQFTPPGVSKELATKIYFSGINPRVTSSHELHKRLGIALGDQTLGCPTINFARELYKASPDTTQVYQWFFKAKLGKTKFLCTDWAGACHCDELYPIFGFPFSRRDEHLARERDISREVMQFIGEFLRTGHPGIPEWEPYFLVGGAENDLIAPYYELDNQARRPESFRFNLKQLECELLWA